MIPIMSELCYATISRKRPTGLDILGGRLRNVPDWVFFEKVARFLFFKQSCQKPKKLLEVVEVVKICGAIVAHPWHGRGGAGGVWGGNNFTRKSRRLFHAGVESKRNTETRTITTPSLRQT